MWPIDRPPQWVGRGQELAVLRAGVEALRRDEGAVVWVEGEPGIGKSSLVAEALAGVSELGWDIGWGMADQLAERLPLSVLQDCLQVRPGSPDPRRAHAAGLLRSQRLGLFAGGDASVNGVEVLMALAEELCAAAPAVMVLDDLQWADDASLLVWHQLAACIGQLRLLLIATCRPAPRRPEVQQVRGAVVRRGGAVITLGPLPETDVAALVTAMVGAPPGDALRRLTARAAGNLSRVDHGVSRTRQAAGLGRPWLRFVLPPDLPEDLAVDVASRLRAAAKAAGVDVAWIEAPLDEEFSPVLRRRVDAGLGWLTAAGEDVPAALEVMSLGEFEPDVWLRPAVADRVIGVGELAGLDVVHGPRRLSPVTYDTWLAVLREENPRFEFTDPPFRRSLPITLAFAASTSGPTAVLTGPHRRLGDRPGPAEPDPAADPADLVRARIDGSPLTAAAALVWSGDLPRLLQQVLVDTADSVVF